MTHRSSETFYIQSFLVHGNKKDSIRTETHKYKPEQVLQYKTDMKLLNASLKPYS